MIIKMDKIIKQENIESLATRLENSKSTAEALGFLELFKFWLIEEGKEEEPAWKKKLNDTFLKHSEKGQ